MAARESMPYDRFEDELTIKAVAVEHKNYLLVQQNVRVVISSNETAKLKAANNSLKNPQCN